MMPPVTAILAERARPVMPQHYGKLVTIDGLTIEASGLHVPVGTNVRITTADGGRAQAEVIGFRGARTTLMALQSSTSFVSNAAVVPEQGSADVPVGPALLGRVLGALGEPLDGAGPVVAPDHWPLDGHEENVLERGSVHTAIDVGVRAINALLTVGEGQRVAIIAGSGVGKSVLLGQMLAGTDADVIVVGLIGERGREVSDFLATKMSAEVRAKSVVVAVPADHAPVLRLRAAMRATAIAEFFRAQGLRVLLLIDSLTRVAHAQREIGLALGEPPTVKGYPPSTFGLIPRLVERAGNHATSGGSITALYTVLADGDDLDDPIVDAARAIVDGHIVLVRDLADQGVFPAIDIGRSLSRVMSDIVEPDHVALAQIVRRWWSVYATNRDLVLMGAYAPGSDEELDAAIERHPAILDLLRQAPGERVTMKASVDAMAKLVAE